MRSKRSGKKRWITLHQESWKSSREDTSCMLTNLYDLGQLAGFYHLCHLSWSGCTQVIAASLPWLSQLCPGANCNLHLPKQIPQIWSPPDLLALLFGPRLGGKAGMAGGHLVRDLRHLFRQHICQDVDGVSLGLGGGCSSQEDLQQSDLQERASVGGWSRKESSFLLLHLPKLDSSKPTLQGFTRPHSASDRQDKCGELSSSV